MQQKISVIIAGTTGLVGQATLNEALENECIERIYSLSRTAIEPVNKKLTQWLNPNLLPPKQISLTEPPSVGIIALGTTIKQAGSKENLHAVDVQLVIQVAKDMLQLGVQHLIVVSCIGASTTASSHYLRCKGEMESTLAKLNINQITFMQPGPLAGPRKKTRIDERLLQSALTLLSPLMLGKLANYQAIESSEVAKAIIELSLNDQGTNKKQIQRINSIQMRLLAKES